MFTQCPHCHTNFSISDQQLTVAGGKVRCGKCDGVFNALYTLSRDPLSSCEQAEVLQISSIDRLSSDGVAESYQLGQVDEENSAPPAPRTSGLTWGVLGLLLSALLVVQAGHFMSNPLAQGYPALRPLIEQLCAISGCELTLQRAPEQITITQRDLRTHPTIPGALLINITLSNDAPFTQPYPELKLSFFDLNQRLLATRTFQPPEYLSQQIDLNNGFPADRPLSTTIELIDPDKRAVNFKFEFL